MTRTGQSDALLAADVPVQAGQALTVAAVGRLAEISALPLPDDNNPPPAGKAKVRFVHASPDAPPVDITVRDGPTLFPNVAFKSVAGYVPVDADSYTLQVRPAGTTNVALTVPNVVLQAGQVVTIFGTGLLGNNTFAALPVVYAGPGARQTPMGLAPGGRGGALLADTVATPGLIDGLTLALVVLAIGVRMRAHRRH